MKTRLRFLLIISIAFSVLFSTSSCSSNKEQKEVPARLVKIEKVSPLSSSTELVFNGTVKEKSTTQVSFRVGGPLTKLNVEIGSFVKKGQTIAAIDQRDYNLQLETAKAQFTQTKGEYERYHELYKKKKLPENTMERMEAAYLMAKSAFENADNALSDTQLNAPVTGYIFEKFTENHETVAPGQPIVSVVDLSKQEVVIHVPASKLISVNDCASAFCSVANANEFNIPIQLSNVATKAGEDNLYEVRFLLSLEEGSKVKPGMSAEVFTNCNMAATGSVTVPVGAVFHYGEKDYIWVFNSKNSQVVRREIKLGELLNEGKIIVEENLKAGEQIVIAGIHSLTEKQKVRPIKAKSKTNIGGQL